MYSRKSFPLYGDILPIRSYETRLLPIIIIIVVVVVVVPIFHEF